MITIYVLTHPSSRECYVGQTSSSIQKRLRSHKLRTGRGSETPVHQWIRSLPGSPDITSLETVMDAGGVEDKWIVKYIRMGYKVLNANKGLQKNLRHATPAELQSLLQYCPKTGHLYWKECDDPSIFSSTEDYERHQSKVGRRADRKISTQNFNYMRLTVFNVHLRAHRVIYMIMTDSSVKKDHDITHRDYNPFNNQWDNLHQITRSEHSHLKPIRINCSGKRPGVSWSQRLGRWQAYITANGKQKHLGWHKDKADAIAARKAAEARYKKS